MTCPSEVYQRLLSVKLTLGDWGVAIWLAVRLREEGRVGGGNAGLLAEVGGEARRLEVHTASPVSIYEKGRTVNTCLCAKGHHIKKA